MAKKKTDRDAVYRYVTEKILAALKQGVAPWQRPWTIDGNNLSVPMNIRRKKPYRGSNRFLLGWWAMEEGWDSRWWGTWKAWGEKGGEVREEEKKRSAFVTFFKWVPIYEEDDEGEKEQVGHYPLLRYFRVWNYRQLVEGSVENPEPEPEDKDEKEFTPIEAAEQVVDLYHTNLGGPQINYGGNRASYSPRLDIISMPKPEQFVSPEEFYSTLFHEEAHSTGHETRLDRKEGMEQILFGSDRYSKEELVAEMAAAMMCAEVGILEEVFDNSAAYLGNWLSKLQDNPRWIVQAGGLAQKAVDHILGVSFGEECA